MVNGVFQVQDSVLDGVADVVLGVGSGGGHLLVGAAFRQLLMLQNNNITPPSAPPHWQFVEVEEGDSLP